jgi:Helix-turn-helix.
VATFKQLRQQAGWSVFALAKEADVSPSTINRIERNQENTVTRKTVYKILNTISNKLGRIENKITIEEVEGLDRVVKQEDQ